MEGDAAVVAMMEGGDSLDLVVMLASLVSLVKLCFHLCFSLTTGKW